MSITYTHIKLKSQVHISKASVTAATCTPHLPLLCTLLVTYITAVLGFTDRDTLIMKISYMFAFLLVDAHYSKTKDEEKKLRMEMESFYRVGTNSNSDDDEASPHDKNVGVVPWCWPKTRKWFNFPEDSDSYPLHGFKQLPRNCSDYQSVIKTDADWTALQKLYDEAYKLTMSDKGAFSDLIAITPKNENLKGAKLFKAYFEKVWRRAKKHEWINATMRNLSALPFQVYDENLKKWPMPSKVRTSEVMFDNT